MQLRSPATNGLALFDYEQNRDYRLLVATEDQKIYAYDKEGTFDGISGIAAPIFDLTKEVIGSIGVAFISSSLDSKTIKKIIKETISTAKNISREMGYLEKSKRSS